MIIGSMKEVFLSRAREIFLFDCRVAGVDHQTIDTYQDVLSAFIRFAGDIQVRQLTPDHVGMYIANLSDGPYDEDDRDDQVMSQYAMIQTWIHWMYSQKFIHDRESYFNRPVRLSYLFPQSMNVYRIKTLAV